MHRPVRILQLEPRDAGLFWDRVFPWIDRAYAETDLHVVLRPSSTCRRSSWIRQARVPDREAPRVRLSHKAGRRIFAGDFEHHGRFYCAPQNIPGDARRTMQINAEPCAEFDFSAMHPRLAYNLAGIPMDGDPYDIGRGFERKHVKLAVLIAFNATDPLSAIHALVRDDDDMQISYALATKIVAAIFERHDVIRRMLCADAGIKLMNLDATIIMDVLEALVARGIPCIGIHDSVVLPERYGGDAQAEMEKSWALHSKGPTLCEIKGKTAILPHMREMRSTSGVS